jgi:uncharacterized membrane protein YdjX (TVP38/TMEM64 family)
MDTGLNVLWESLPGIGLADLNPANWSLTHIKLAQNGLANWYAQHPLTVTMLYAGTFTLLTALCLPGAAMLMLVAGASFGLAWGCVVATLASTAGAILTMLAARHSLRQWAQSRFGRRLQQFDEGLGREGAYYLVSLRLPPVIPFVPVNVLSGLTNLPTWTFFWSSALGMLPATALYVNIGVTLAQVDSLDALHSGDLVIAIMGLALIPLGAALVRRLPRRQF